ncbi:MAG: molybdopterin-dependent oxidoreductase, partial [Candidatus Binatia bacterium]|nr:molybdopterin-dependent oxidoreductase [Candidatus Binatia bacterium]
MHVWTSTQASFGIRALLAQALQIPMEQIVLTPAFVGGGFGGRHSLVASHVCTALAMKTRRPVQLVFSRTEEFCGANPRHPVTIRVKTGAKRDGSLIARELRAVFNTGAYSDFGVLLPGTACGMASGVYRIPNVRAEGYTVYTNAPNCGAYRAPGAPQMTFAVESHMDNFARQLSIDPLEFRMKNLMQPGDLSLMGLKLNNSPLSVMKKAAEGINWGKPAGKNRGKGLACSEHPIIPMETSIGLTIQEDGTVEILSGAIDLGGTNTAVAQIVAEELGLAFEEVRMVSANTDTALEAPPSGGSWITYNVGNAALNAAQNARQKLLELAARELDMEPDR